MLSFPGRQEQKRVDGTTREVKKVRKARNRRQEWNMMAYDKELRPDNRLSQSVHHGASSEGSLSPDTSDRGRASFEEGTDKRGLGISFQTALISGGLLAVVSLKS